jgi:hypothetical protein
MDHFTGSLSNIYLMVMRFVILILIAYTLSDTILLDIIWADITLTVTMSMSMGTAGKSKNSRFG